MKYTVRGISRKLNIPIGKKCYFYTFGNWKKLIIHLLLSLNLVPKEVR